METMVQDLRHGVRQLRRNPGFTLIAVFTLALGIAVNTTMFSLVSAFLLRRPPGREPERVAVVTSVDPSQGFQADATPVSVPNYLAWRQANHVFADMAAADEYRTVSLTLEGKSEAFVPRRCLRITSARSVSPRNSDASSSPGGSCFPWSARFPRPLPC